MLEIVGVSKIPGRPGRAVRAPRASRLLLALASRTKYCASLSRPEDPVVLHGSRLPPTHVVGFARGGTRWHQIPVQVDQRDFVNPGQILNRPASACASLPDGSSYKMLVYTNPASAAPGYTWWPTFTGVAGDSGLAGQRRGLVPLR